VERLEPGRLLVLRSTRHLPVSWRRRGLAMDWIWSWQLDEPVLGRTRVIQRNRMRLEPAWFERAFLATIVPADFIMARSHLRGLRRLAQDSVSSAVRNPRISRTAGRWRSVAMLAWPLPRYSRSRAPGMRSAVSRNSSGV
jgi:hypothetical protein